MLQDVKAVDEGYWIGSRLLLFEYLDLGQAVKVSTS